MSSLLQQLENNEAVLLMYLAGELPETDRAEVDQMLAGDPALRLELSELTAMQDQMSAAFAQADGIVHLSRRDAAVREVARAINNAKAEAPQHAKAARQPQRSRMRVAFWAYPIAAAALLAVGIMILRPTHPAAVPLAENKSFVTILDVLPSPNPDDSLAPGEKQARELASVDTTRSSNFGGADPLDWEQH